MTTVEDARQALRNRLIEHDGGYTRGEEFDLLEVFIDKKIAKALAHDAALRAHMAAKGRSP